MLNIVEIINADKPIVEFLSAENLKSWQSVKNAYKNILIGLYRLEARNKLNIYKEFDTSIRENDSYIYNCIICYLEQLINISESEFELFEYSFKENIEISNKLSSNIQKYVRIRTKI